MKTAQKKQKTPTTQAFTEIEDVRENYVLLKGGSASVVIEVQSTNFALLSEAEQNVKLLSYASLLNSLSFPIQIMVRSKKIDITSYIKSLEQQAQHVSFDSIETSQRGRISSYIQHYKAFIEEMTKVNTVLDKKFYIAIPYSALEQGAKGALKQNDTFETAKANLKIKADSLITQIQHLSLRARILDKEELLSLCYELFNSQIPSNHMGQSFGSTLVEKKI